MVRAGAGRLALCLPTMDLKAPKGLSLNICDIHGLLLQSQSRRSGSAVNDGLQNPRHHLSTSVSKNEYKMSEGKVKETMGEIVFSTPATYHFR